MARDSMIAGGVRDTVDATLAGLGLSLSSPAAYEAVARFGGLELASMLGVREARRALSRERPRLISLCRNDLRLQEAELCDREGDAGAAG